MTGSVQIKNGTYYAVINIFDNNGKKKQKWISSGYSVRGNKKNAEKFLRDKINEFESKEIRLKEDILFCDYAALWLDTVKLKIDVITYQGYECLVNAHIIPYFKTENKTLNEITREDIQLFVNKKFKNGRVDGKGGLSPKSIKNIFAIIHQIFIEAIKSEIIANDPCKYVTLPKKTKHQPNFYSTEEVKTLFDSIKDEPLYPLIYFTLVFGLRRSEVLGLKWDCIDFDRNLITIKHTVVKFSDIVEKDATKTESSYRSFPLNENVKQILIKLKENEIKNKKIFGQQYCLNDYIFKKDNGELHRPDYITRKFPQLLKKYNLRKIRFHDLRHSCASLLVINGFQLKDVQEWLGHADFQTTANIYAHLDVQRKQEIAASFSGTFTF